MSPAEYNSKNYFDWFLKAENELKSAQAIFGYYEEPPTDMICYHCHQTVEKTLKGYLIAKGVTFTKIHDLIALLNLCLQIDKTLEALRSEIKILSKYYVETKYPPDMPIIYPKEESKEAISMAERIFADIKSKLE